MTVQNVLRRPMWGFLAFLVALVALIASLVSLTGGQSDQPPIAFSQLAAKTGGNTKVVDRIAVDGGKSKTIFKNDDFKVVGKCVITGPGNFAAQYGVKALKKHSAIFSTNDGNETDFKFGPSDPLYHFTSYEPDAGVATFSAYDYYQEFWGESPGGRVLSGRVAAGVKVTSRTDCTYAGLFIG